MPLITAVLRPLLNDIPIISKGGIVLGLFRTRNFEIREPYQNFKIVGLAIIDLSLGWEIVPLRFLGDARFQGAFDMRRT